MGNWQQQQAEAFTIQALIMWNVLAREDDPQFHWIFQHITLSTPCQKGFLCSSKYSDSSYFLITSGKKFPESDLIFSFSSLQDVSCSLYLFISSFLTHYLDYKAEIGKANKQRLSKAAAKLGL